MTSVPEPTNPRTTDSPSDIVADAMVALVAHNPRTREEAEGLLAFWVRRPEMTDADVTEVGARLFPETEQATNPIDVADGHVVHVCCGKVDDAEHRNFCPQYRDGYANGYVDCIVQKAKVSPEVTAAMETFAARYDALAGPERNAFRDVVASAFLPADTRAACPDWCTIDHAEDDDRDDLNLHMGDDHTDGTVRDLLDVHEDRGSKLRVVVARTDNLDAGTRGTPALLVTADLELTTWEQAAELARTILDGFGYLNGAEKD